jgi:ferredoxin-NADP reductase
MDRMTVVVRESIAAAPRVRTLTLARTDGGALPGWSAGAHIDIDVPGLGTRSYSLIDTDAGDAEAPTQYRIGVLLDEKTRGGSAFMHRLAEGATLEIFPPANNFALSPGAGAVALMAGGIGVTPLLSMAAALREAGRPFSFHYAGRSRADLAFVGDVERLAGARAQIHCDDEAGGLFDLRGLMSGMDAASSLYLCGPLPMIDAAISIARELGWSEGRLRFEIFAAPAQKAADSAFEIELKGSGRVFTVPPGKSIVDVLAEAGEDPMIDCCRGECGVCQTGVLAGEVDHRDYYLSDAEKATNRTMQICVSRAKSKRLVLDL